MAQVLEHHRAGPDLGDRIRDALAGDVGCRAVNRLEHRRILLLGIDVAARRQPDRAGDGRAEVGKDVPEEIRADDDVEPVRVLHEVGGQDVDVVLGRLDARIVRRDGGEALVPVRHAVDDSVRFGRRRHVAARPRHRQLERVAHDAVAAPAREDRLLDGQLLRRAPVEAPADLRVLPFVVLAHDHHVDVRGPAAGERRPGPLQEANGSQVDVLMEAAPDRDQKAPERDVVRHTGKSHGAEEDRLERPEPVETVFRHHAAGFGVALAAPVERRPLDVEAEPAARGVEDAHAFGHDFLADPVAGDRGDTVSHRIPPSALACGGT